MKKYLIASMLTAFSVSTPVLAQSYDKGDDTAHIMRDGRYTQSTDAQERTTTTTTQPARIEPSARYSASNDEPVYDPGFYVGGYGGYNWTDADLGSESADLRGGDYGAFVGAELDALLNGWMGLTGAIEGFYGWSDADDTISVAGVPVDLEKDHEWGVNVRPGLTFIDRYSPFGMKPYAIMGYRHTNFEASSAAGSADESFDGFELGIGSELIAYDSFGVRLDYSHVFYGEEGGIDPDENDLRLGLAYHF